VDAHPPETSPADDPLAAVGALGDRLRRSLYRFVAEEHRAVSRSEAAEATGVTRAAAAFHLDRLVADGLLDAEFRRLGGRQGPGAGRPTKLYRRAATDIAVSLPPRRYDLAADLLAAAVDESTATGEAVDAALRRLARERGVAMAASASARTAVDVLADHGYEPVVDGDEVALANCPFHALVAGHRALVCGMNLALLHGFVDALADRPFSARLQPGQTHCCVRLTAAGPKRRRP
jgi:predicted ArsR family transcriptional regulator